MEQNNFQKMSGAIAAAESIQYIGLTIDEVSSLYGVPVPLLEAAIHSVNPEILTMRERIRMMLDNQTEPQCPTVSRLSPVRNFAIEKKKGVRESSFKKYGPSINAYATSTRSLPIICRENRISYSTCRTFMMHYYPEAAQRHIDILEGRFAVTGSEE